MGLLRNAGRPPRITQRPIAREDGPKRRAAARRSAVIRDVLGMDSPHSPHPEERALARVSKDASWARPQGVAMVRDARAKRPALLTMRTECVFGNAIAPLASSRYEPISRLARNLVSRAAVGWPDKLGSATPACLRIGTQ